MTSIVLSHVDYRVDAELTSDRVSLIIGRDEHTPCIQVNYHRSDIVALRGTTKCWEKWHDQIERSIGYMRVMGVPLDKIDYVMMTVVVHLGAWDREDWL